MAVKYLKKFRYKNSKLKILNKILDKLSDILIKYRDRIIVVVSIIFFIVVLSIVVTTHSDTQVDYKKETETEEEIITESYQGDRFITEHFPIFKDVVFVGDSYAHHLALELGFDTTVYSSPGLTLKDLKYCFNSAKDNQKKYVVIFVGPNDFRFSIDPDVFKSELDNYITMFNKDSKIIMCTYLSSIFTNDLTTAKSVKYKISDYDDEIKKVVEENENVYYLDLKYLEGKPEYYKKVEDDPDRIHFNYRFYVEFINKLYKFILTIK